MRKFASLTQVRMHYVNYSELEDKIKEDTVIFFDMDGTLIDTNLTNFLAYKKAILSVRKSDYNLVYNPDKRFNRDSLKAAVPNLTDVEYERIIQEKEKCYDEFLHEARLNTEVTNILLKYYKTNRTILVTNCREKRVLTTLNHFRLLDKFSRMFFRPQVGSGNVVNKYHNAISALGISPDKIVVFENEETEIANALTAGINIIYKVWKNL